ncbi:AMP-binding protein [Sphingopyxis macrogoltabida]|uniref:3-methylmercaptopropionyl-CoA ligase n=1 Tax=Sphingopyxis macrogoltabida TaxID=33050 RepID=A0A0N9UV43_SPHMC|nr:AMP-binding protein [Sphingopyxis macrogoltabida]ALH79337.1 AMP-binding protein [Sphingopyxis macrogoltabida]
MTDSFVRGDHSEALIEMTIGALFDRTAERYADGEALVVRHQNVRWTWRALRERVDAVAAGLLERGLKPGDRVGIWAPNCAEWVVVQFATAKAGLILVNINPAYRVAELDYALNKVGCAALILAPSHKSSDYVAMLGELAPELATAPPGMLHAARLPDLRLVFVLGETEHAGCLPFAALAGNDISALADIRLDPAMPVNIQFTSGTTGFPKGATLSHRNILNNGAFVGARIGLTSRDRLCIPVPLYHCFGMVMGNLACAVHGATMVYPAEAFDPGAVLETVEAERCTALYGVPTMFIAALQHPDFDRFDLSSLRTGIMAGSPCPMAVMREVIDRMHMDQVTIAYGMTETSPVSFQSDTDDPLDLRVSTVGRVQPHLEVKLIDLGGNIVARGETGELCTRGYSVMLGYWDDAERTAEALDADGWMHTGDLATIDEDGYCRIVGRIKDMVIRGGENIYPREIEEYLLTHPDIVDVQGVGIPDEKYGEEMCVWIVARAGAPLTEDDVRAHCRGRIAHFKIPRHILFVDGFPMTVTGKVQKFAMREQTLKLLKEREEGVRYG